MPTSPWLERDLTQMFRYFKYYFPQNPPTVVTAITELVGDAYLVNDTLLMLSLDYFMGEHFRPTTRITFQMPPAAIQAGVYDDKISPASPAAWQGRLKRINH